ncbi:MAG: glycosyltransferase [Pseudomonadota bacterium]
MAGLIGQQAENQHAVFASVSCVDTERAANYLADTAPLLSSRKFANRLWWLPALAALVVVPALLRPDLALQFVSGWLTALFLTLIVCRGALIGVSAFSTQKPRSLPTTAHLPAGDWPVYTVLLPLFKEAASVPNLVDALKRLDYPIDCLNVIFLTEESDTETRQALRAEALPATWTVLTLPDGVPRTKPRALNVGLARSRGRFLTVYDAEDRPHPQQLKASVAAFEADPAGDLGCVQAPLRAHNASRSWIAGHWGLEYDIHFGLIVPALAQADLPIALGGTSNHFRVDVLKACGGWDAWNVTEDADLGLRLARLGWRISVIAPPTLEEAPEQLGIWTAQRSRWIKGYIQTWGVLMARPSEALHDIGLRGFLSIQLLLGGAILSACLHGPLLAWCLASLVVPGMGVGVSSLLIIGLGYLISAWAAFLAPGRRSRRWLLVLTLPIYWPLLSIAAARAIVELFRSPYSWAKTPHGLTTHTPSLDPAAFY